VASIVEVNWPSLGSSEASLMNRPTMPHIFSGPQVLLLRKT
jgi:hypothetical protein